MICPEHHEFRDRGVHKSQAVQPGPTTPLQSERCQASSSLRSREKSFPSRLFSGPPRQLPKSGVLPSVTNPLLHSVNSMIVAETTSLRLGKGASLAASCKLDFKAGRSAMSGRRREVNSATNGLSAALPGIPTEGEKNLHAGHQGEEGGGQSSYRLGLARKSCSPNIETYSTYSDQLASSATAHSLY